MGMSGICFVWPICRCIRCRLETADRHPRSSVVSAIKRTKNNANTLLAIVELINQNKALTMAPMTFAHSNTLRATRAPAQKKKEKETYFFFDQRKAFTLILHYLVIFQTRSVFYECSSSKNNNNSSSNNSNNK
jgi:hypothetical protein